MNKKKLYSLLAVLLVISAGVAVYFGMNRQSSAREIPSGTNFAKVRKLSAGAKPVCVNENTTLNDVVSADDTLPYDKSFSYAVGGVIPDMPAGNIDLTLSNYSPTSAMGYVDYSDDNQQSTVQDLKTFNFSISRANPEHPWELKSFIACTKK